jgi:trans-aconitate 2-methyltransferase
LEDWNAQQYLQFESERTRPAFDLLARVPLHAPARIADLGCGPGNSTELLVKRFPQAEIVGIDSSDDMIDNARVRLPRVKFEIADVVHWRSDVPSDLIFANAVLQWVPNHIALMVRLMGQLTRRGSLAVQVPDNFAEPSHVLSARSQRAHHSATSYAMRPPRARRLAASQIILRRCRRIAPASTFGARLMFTRWRILTRLSNG